MAKLPVSFFSHGSTMMLGEETESADYWKKAGDEALENGIKGVIMMGLIGLQTAQIESTSPQTQTQESRPSHTSTRPSTSTTSSTPIWTPMPRYGDNLAQESVPEQWALEFLQAVEDVFAHNSGPKLRRTLTRLMKHPLYRDAHATDYHFMASVFVAGAVGDVEDEGELGQLKAETWELTNMCNSQFMIGDWPKPVMAI